MPWSYEIFYFVKISCTYITRKYIIQGSRCQFGMFKQPDWSFSFFTYEGKSLDNFISHIWYILYITSRLNEAKNISRYTEISSIRKTS